LAPNVIHLNFIQLDVVLLLSVLFAMNMSKARSFVQQTHLKSAIQPADVGTKTATILMGGCANPSF
jgi:hypothetical protein